jgi:hypothetical protein
MLAFIMELGNGKTYLTTGESASTMTRKSKMLLLGQPYYGHQ